MNFLSYYKFENTVVLQHIQYKKLLFSTILHVVVVRYHKCLFCMMILLVE